MENTNVFESPERIVITSAMYNAFCSVKDDQRRAEFIKCYLDYMFTGAFKYSTEEINAYVEILDSMTPAELYIDSLDNA